jgi:glucuronate isomerase
MTDNKNWSEYYGDLYKRYIDMAETISEEEAIARYDEIIRDIKLTVSARNYQIMKRGEKQLMASTDDLTYYLRTHNEWAKRQKWSPKLTVLMRARGYYR